MLHFLTYYFYYYHVDPEISIKGWFLRSEGIKGSTVLRYFVLVKNILNCYAAEQNGKAVGRIDLMEMFSNTSIISLPTHALIIVSFSYIIIFNDSIFVFIYKIFIFRYT